MASESAAAEEMAAQSVTALYVGDLELTVAEEELSRLFSEKGDVISVKICRDQNTQRSLGYGYVNYTNPQDAARALEELNFTPLNGRQIRISYSNRDNNLRRSGAGNIFVKNLDKSIDHKSLHKIFSSFGNIISCKVETDASGHSKGYGFVQYNSDEAAKKAIEELNGLLFHGKEIYVGPFINKQERAMFIDKTRFTNVFVKNLSGSTMEEDLKSKFGQFGSITSAVIMKDEDGNSKCFGFVNFENAEDAAKSVESLNGQVFDGKELYVGRAQKKAERERELEIRREQIEKEARERSLGLNNLYLKNLDDGIENDKLKELFSPFGTITSCKVMYDSKGMSKGSGFVAFSTSQEASRALTEMNGKMVGSKPLYVAIAERKEARQAKLQALFSTIRPNTIVPAVNLPVNVYPHGGPGLGQQIFYGQAPPPILPTSPGFGYQQQQYVPGMRPPGTLLPNFFLPLVQQGPHGRRPSGRREDADSARQSQLPFQMMHQQMIARGNVYQVPQGYGLSRDVSTQGSSGGMLSVPREIDRLTVGDKKILHPVPVGALASALANASPSEQRMMLGERLYPLVEQLEQGNAAKVTGMLLEMDQTEVLHLLESPDSLAAKVAEAKDVLRNVSQSQLPSTA